MKSETVSVRQIFQDQRQYKVPFYQRAYVWNREDQWERLWLDIQDKAESRLAGAVPNPHFLGAVVLEPQPRVGLLGVEGLHIIDGQQRLTTLQYVLAALALVLRADNQTGLLSLVDGCLRNPNLDTMENKEVEVFKLWPTFRDREHYCAALSATDLQTLRERFPTSFTASDTLRKINVDHPPALEAIWFFQEQIQSWLAAQGETRAIAMSRLTEAMLTDLNIVSISLGENDDAQVIFETLNGHGAQLHATDLIRNFVFMRADREDANAGTLYTTYWSQFETDFWSENQRRGRLSKPRLEWFMQTVLQAKSGSDVDAGRVYSEYRRFAFGPPIIPAQDQLGILNSLAQHYRELVSGDGSTPIADFGKDIAVWDASTTHALALAISTSDQIAHTQQQMFRDITSYFVRRGVCGLTNKSYNKIFGQILRRLNETQLTPATLRNSLAALEGEASRWPSDEEFRRSWLDARVYPGNLDAPRVKWILAKLERKLRSARTEEPVPLTLELLDIDHILPMSWFEHWPLGDGTHCNNIEAHAAMLAKFAGQTSERHQLINQREDKKATIGNLTLLHLGLNRSLQNRAFADKAAGLFKESNLQLNRPLMQLEEWNETGIGQRGEALYSAAAELWPGPTVSA
ncbi:DUF262 domain-containing protein [Reyranella sp.]|uniref:DUF262 domain-containing protein n=1 Tax=Reyranella sp. TaxID=1929291 RepID=UPI003BACA79E